MHWETCLCGFHHQKTMIGYPVSSSVEVVK